MFFQFRACTTNLRVSSEIMDDRVIPRRHREKNGIICSSPTDTLHIVEIIFVALGTGYMLPYNVLITPIDFYHYIYPSHSSILLYIVPIHRALLLIALLLMVTPCCTYSTKHVSWHILITIPFIIISFALGLYPYLPEYIDLMDESLFFIVLLVICAFCGFLGGTIQNAVTSFCNHLPSQYMKASISGQAMAGILVCILKIAIKGMNRLDNDIWEGKVYFVIGAVMNGLCALLFIGVKRTKLIRFYFRKRELTDYLSKYDAVSFRSKATEELIARKKLEQQYMRQLDGNQDHFHRDLHREHPSESRESKPLIYRGEEGTGYMSVFREIANLAVGVFIVHIATFLYFPSLMISIPSQLPIFVNGDDWFGLILLTEYNVFDYIGRQFLSRYRFCITMRNIVAFAVLRTAVIYPLFCVMYKGLFRNDIVLHLVNIIGAMSNGYLVCLMFIFLTDLSRSKRNRSSAFHHISATIMTLSLNLGILFGSVAAIVINKYLL